MAVIAHISKRANPCHANACITQQCLHNSGASFAVFLRSAHCLLFIYFHLLFIELYEYAKFLHDLNQLFKLNTDRILVRLAELSHFIIYLQFCWCRVSRVTQQTVLFYCLILYFRHIIESVKFSDFNLKEKCHHKNLHSLKIKWEKEYFYLYIKLFFTL